MAGDLLEPCRAGNLDGAPMADGADVVTLRLPVQYYDPSIVPLTIAPDRPATTICKVSLVIDQNLAPLGGDFPRDRSAVRPHLDSTRGSTTSRTCTVAERLDGSLHDVKALSSPPMAVRRLRRATGQIAADMGT
ncbi:MAG: hypothetical protein U1E30_03070 [Rhodoblastus sp.]